MGAGKVELCHNSFFLLDPLRGGGGGGGLPYETDGDARRLA